MFTPHKILLEDYLLNPKQIKAVKAYIVRDQTDDTDSDALTATITNHTRSNATCEDPILQKIYLQKGSKLAVNSSEVYIVISGRVVMAVLTGDDW